MKTRSYLIIGLAMLLLQACGDSNQGSNVAESASDSRDEVSAAESGSESGGDSLSGGAASYQISDENYFTDSFNQVNVLGIITNTGDVPLRFIEINVELTDSEGIVLANRVSLAPRTEIQPGDSTPFQVPVYLESGEWADWQISLDFESGGDPSISPTYQEFELVSFNGEQDDNGGYEVTGEVRNSGDKVAEQNVILVAVYDADGKLLAVGPTFPEEYSMGPGATSPFTVYFTEMAEGSPDHIEIWGEATFYQE